MLTCEESLGGYGFPPGLARWAYTPGKDLYRSIRSSSRFVHLPIACPFGPTLWAIRIPLQSELRTKLCLSGFTGRGTSTQYSF